MAKKVNPYPNSFIGDFSYTIDARGRTNFPAPFRHALSKESKDRVVIVRGLDTCLWVFPRDVWEKHDARINDDPYSPQKQRLMQRLVYLGARESGFDAQGRITIPPRLIHLAKLEKEVLILGVGKRVEIWNPEIYDQYVLKNGASAETILEEILTRPPVKPGDPSAGGTSRD